LRQITRSDTNMRDQHYHLNQLAKDAKSGGHAVSDVNTSDYLDILNDLESSITTITKLCASYIISNLNAIRLSNKEYYTLNFKNNCLYYHRVRPEQIDRYQLNFNSAELLFNNVPQSSDFLITFLHQIDHVANDLMESRAAFFSKTELSHG